MFKVYVCSVPSKLINALDRYGGNRETTRHSTRTRFERIRRQMQTCVCPNEPEAFLRTNSPIASRHRSCGTKGGTHLGAVRIWHIATPPDRDRLICIAKSRQFPAPFHRPRGATSPIHLRCHHELPTAEPSNIAQSFDLAHEAPSLTKCCPFVLIVETTRS